jgi:hypothetical protein
MAGTRSIWPGAAVRTLIRLVALAAAAQIRQPRLLALPCFGKSLDASLDGLAQRQVFPLGDQHLLQANCIGSRGQDRCDQALDRSIQLIRRHNCLDQAPG